MWRPLAPARAADERLDSSSRSPLRPARTVTARRPAADWARASDDRLARRGPRGAVRRAARASATTAASSPPQALAAGAWGVLVAPGSTPTAELAARARCSRRPTRSAALQALATAWRRELGAEVIGVTGSTGKTSTKDLLLALLAAAPRHDRLARELQHRDRPAARDPRGAAPSTEVLVLEMAMRGAGQIAELTAIAEPDVGVIVSVGPGAPRAARDARGDRGGQGRADRRADAGVDRRHPRRRSRCWRRTCAPTCRRSRSGQGAMCSFVSERDERVVIDAMGRAARARGAVPPGPSANRSARRRRRRAGGRGDADAGAWSSR